MEEQTWNEGRDKQQRALEDETIQMEVMAWLETIPRALLRDYRQRAVSSPKFSWELTKMRDWNLPLASARWRPVMPVRFCLYFFSKVLGKRLLQIGVWKKTRNVDLEKWQASGRKAERCSIWDSVVLWLRCWQRYISQGHELVENRGYECRGITTGRLDSEKLIRNKK